MCGIAGIWNKDGTGIDDNELDVLVNSLSHRGPDSNGKWINKNLGLAHTRLKIIDLSDSANQPFTDGGDVLVFNGEIFNYKKIKDKLSDEYNYKTKSDTEVLYFALQKWGENCLNIIDGQFAFAYYNKKENSLLIARDHVGICPLYISNDQNKFIFSSEIKPILNLKKSTIDKQGIIDYFSFRYNIQNGHTLFSNIKRFHPAHYTKIDLNNHKIIEKRYWRLSFQENDYDNIDLQDYFNKILDNEINKQTISDVPLGMYLSGGIDSGALLHGFSKYISPINTFTIGFSESDGDFQRVNNLHRKLNFNKNIIPFNIDLMRDIEDIVFSLEEPFGDLIISANYVLSKFASKHVKVVLSGEGGDEAFFGYDHQRAFLRMFNYSKNPLANYLMKFSLNILPAKVIALANNYPGGFSINELNQIRETYSNISNPSSAYINLISLFNKNDIRNIFENSFISDTNGVPDHKTIKELFSIDNNLWQSIMRAEVEQFTLIINLLKQERYGMRFSLEGRVPLVSKNILKFAASLPYKNLIGKVNKEYLIKYSRSKIIKKNPFSVFTSPEYKKILIHLCDNYVNKKAVHETGILKWGGVKNIIASIDKGSLLSIKKSMSILIFMVWWKKYRKFLEF